MVICIASPPGMFAVILMFVQEECLPQLVARVLHPGILKDAMVKGPQNPACWVSQMYPKINMSREKGFHA